MEKVRTLLLFVSILWIGPLSLPAQTTAEKQQAATLIFHANRLYGSKKYDEALEKVAKAVKLAPRNDGYQAYAAKLAALAGKHEDSLRYAREAVKLDPKNATHHVLLMRAAIETKAYEQAKESATKAISFGASRQGQSTFNEAKNILAKADDHIAEQYRAAAAALQGEQKYAEALAKVKDGLALVPSSKALTEARVAVERFMDQEKELDRYALQAPPEVEQTIQTLAEYLVKPAKDDRGKARAIYRWVTDRVAYDAEGFFTGKKASCDAEAVLKNRKCVCAGYANLIEKLSVQAGLEAVVVSGYAKGYGYKPGVDVTRSGHAWNAVKLDGKWRLLDATWGAGTLNAKQQYDKHFDSQFFLVPAEQLIFSHFPKEPQWQLLQSPLDLSAFEKWAKPPRELFAMGVTPQAVRAHIEKNPKADFVQAFGFRGGPVQLQAAPLEKKLRAGTKYVFRIAAPEVQELTLVNGDTRQVLTRKDTVFEGEVVPRKGSLHVMVKTAGDRSLPIILQYDVE